VSRTLLKLNPFAYILLQMTARLRRATLFLCLAFLATIARAGVVEDSFGSLPDGTAVQRWTIVNSSGASVAVISYGATVISLKIPDRAGKLDDIVLGFDRLDDYLADSPFFGAIVGRYANRVGGASFTLNGIQFRLAANDGRNTLHGGWRGFDKVIWTGSRIDDQSVEFTYLSKDGEEGFPGNLTARVRYTLSDSNALKIEYSATTDKDTVVNLTNHSYFNLAGQGNGDVLKQELTIEADQFTPTNARLIPTGEFASVTNTPFDFRRPHQIGLNINADDNQIRIAGGYDMNFVLTKQPGLRHAATLFDPTTGRVMDLWTTEPGLQLYTANGLDGSLTGKGGKAYPMYGAVCLETQHFPDSPNQPAFPTTVLKVGQTYRTTTEYRFTARAASESAASSMPASPDSAPNTPSPPSIDLSTGWTLIKEGKAEGTIEQEAHHPISKSPHLLLLAVTKTAGPGLGRVGATSAIPIPVRDGEWFNVRFSAATERNTVGLVFSLESADGKVLARTTLPEIGRARGGRPATRTSATRSAAAWPRYLVALHARAADPNAHLVITPIEPTNIWLDNLTITPR
jgi:aldose 1-epimerase